LRVQDINQKSIITLEIEKPGMNTLLFGCPNFYVNKILFFVTFQLSEEGITKTSAIDYFDVYLISISELVVELPTSPVKVDGDVRGAPGKPVGGHFIEVSNDGVTYSANESLFLVYDGRCIQCNVSMGSQQNQCKQKVNRTRDLMFIL